MGVYQQFVPETANRHRADLRIDHEASSKDSLFLRASYQRRDPCGYLVRGGQRPDEPGHPGADPRHRHRRRGLDEDLLEHGRQRVPRRLQLRQQRAPEPVQRPAGQRPARPRDRAERRRLPRRLPVLQLLGRVCGQPAREHHRRRLQRRPDHQPELVLTQRQPELGRGQPLPAGRRPVDAEQRDRRPRPGHQPPRIVPVQRRADGQRPRGPSPGLHPRRGRPRLDTRRHRRLLRTTSRSSCRTTGGSTTT